MSALPRRAEARHPRLLSKKKLFAQVSRGLKADLTHNPLAEGNKPARCLRPSGVTSSALAVVAAPLF